VALRGCKVTCRDVEGIEHWVSRIGSGQTTVTVVVKQPEVEHKIRMRDFEAWLESNGRSPAEMALKSRLRELLRK